MSTCNFGPPSDVDRFYDNLNRVLEGNHPDLSEKERFWLEVFQEVARSYEKVPEDESYWLSFAALSDCYEKGKADNRQYLWTACKHNHLDYRKHRRRSRSWEIEYARQRRQNSTKNEWELVDFRLDLRGAIPKLRSQNPLHAQVVTMKWSGESNGGIAAELGITKRQVEDTYQTAVRSLQALMEAN